MDRWLDCRVGRWVDGRVSRWIDVGWNVEWMQRRVPHSVRTSIVQNISIYEST